MADKHARYLVNPDTNHPELIVADQVEDKQKTGWIDPTGVRANGYVYNRPEDQGTTDAAGESLKVRNEFKAEKAKKADDARQASEAEAKKAADAKDAADPSKREGYFGRVADAVEGK